MSNQETLCSGGISMRKLPVNFNPSDLRLFEHELKREIPATALLHLENITVYPAGMLFRGCKVLPESFPAPQVKDAWVGSKAHLKFMVRNCLFRHRQNMERAAFWITDTWSKGYFHWLTDALPRLFTIREKIKRATLLLPGSYQKREYVESSLKPFPIQDMQFVQEPSRFTELNIPTHTAPTGNYNENIIGCLRNLYTDYYHHTRSVGTGSKIYISRGKAPRRKLANEAECIAVLERYGFKTVYFEEHSFEQQVKIALDAQYLISNHGAGLTNMLFMKSGGRVFELRQKGDAFNNCYFALASALQLKYFYQLCDPENANSANLMVDCRLLRKTIEEMLSTY